MKAFLINLDRHPDRLAAAQAQLNRAGVDAERVSAIDGAALSPSERRAVVASFHTILARGRLCTDGQIGCALSHHAVYRRMVDEDIPVAIVFEDDILLTSNFPDSLAYAASLVDATKRQVFLFSDGTYPPISDTSHAFARATEGDCSEAYLITLPAARELLRVNSPIVVPLDSWCRFAARRHIELYRATPATATQDNEHFPSDVPVRGRPNGFLRLFWNVARLIEKPLDALWFRLTGK